MRHHKMMILEILATLCMVHAWGMAQDTPAPAAPAVPVVAAAKEAPPASTAAAPVVENSATQAENAAAVPAATPATQVKSDSPKKFRGMLPRYYKSVVSEEQKQQIYNIQSQYRPQIRELQQKMDALKAEMNQKIENLLTEEQKEAIQIQKDTRNLK